MHYVLVACMAGPLDTGQQISTYLLLHIIPLLLHHLIDLALLKDSKSFHILAKSVAKTYAWRLPRHPLDARPEAFKCFKKPRKKLVSKATQDKTITQELFSYLVPALFAAFKVSCCVESELRRFLRPIQRVPRFLAFQGTSLGNPTVRFDSDSFEIGIDNHASRCMANAPTCLKISTSSMMQGR